MTTCNFRESSFSGSRLRNHSAFPRQELVGIQNEKQYVFSSPKLRFDFEKMTSDISVEIEGDKMYFLNSETSLLQEMLHYLVILESTFPSWRFKAVWQQIILEK